MPTVNISVSLDTTADPPVIVSNRNQCAESGDTIKFQKQDSSSDFDITGFEPTGPGEVFTDPDDGGNGQWYTVLFQSSTAGDHPYTLTVTADETTYDTTESSSSPDNRRPVIRN